MMIPSKTMLEACLAEKGREHRCHGDATFIVYHHADGQEGEELGRVYAESEDTAMQYAIEAWVDCGGDYTEGLSARQLCGTILS